MALILFLFAVAILVFESNAIGDMLVKGSIDLDIVQRAKMNFVFAFVLILLSATWGTHDYYITTG